MGPDIEVWFQQDKFGGQPHIVAQWADLHNAVATAWVTARSDAYRVRRFLGQGPSPTW